MGAGRCSRPTMLGVGCGEDLRRRLSELSVRADQATQLRLLTRPIGNNGAAGISVTR